MQLSRSRAELQARSASHIEVEVKVLGQVERHKLFQKTVMPKTVVSLRLAPTTSVSLNGIIQASLVWANFVKMFLRS